MQLEIDGVPFLLKSPQTFDWLKAYGTVHKVLHKSSSGNLCFFVDGKFGPLFIKYAGAQKIFYQGRIQDAVDALKRAMHIYTTEKHTNIVQLLAHGDIGEGYAAIFKAEHGVSLKSTSSFQALERLRYEPLVVRLSLIDQIYDALTFLSKKDIISVDFSESNILIDFERGKSTLCDLDLYTYGAYINRLGRMPGSPNLLAPEEYRMNAEITQRADVYHMGALAYLFFSEGLFSVNPRFEASKRLFKVVKKAVSPDPRLRFSCPESFLKAWREGVGSMRL